MDYALENLGPERFQLFCQALLCKSYPDAQCLPVGQPDGGRDAISYTRRKPTPEFIVFQVKFVRNPHSIDDPHKWVTDIVRDEAPKIHKLIPHGAAQYVLITNVAGTAHLNRGSIDTVNSLLQEHLTIPAQCWWRNDLCRRLDGESDLKWQFPETLSGNDVLRLVVEMCLDEDSQRRTAAIRSVVRMQFESDRDVRFKQVELHNRLFDLYIDVPLARSDDMRRKRSKHDTDILGYLARRFAEPTEPPSVGTDDRDIGLGAATALLHEAVQVQLPWVVLEGAPGQGKSTITQFICQVHRARLLREPLPSHIPKRLSETHLRLPLKVDLRDLAAWLQGFDPFAATPTHHVEEHSLEAFLCRLISHASGGITFGVNDLHAVSRLTALLLVFDGLDEVANLSLRQEVVDSITKGCQRLKGSAASLQVIVTSRPAAFANSPGLSEHYFCYLELTDLTGHLIEQYSSRWLDAKQLPSQEAAEMRRLLRAKLGQPHIRELARNPMQLAILLGLMHTQGSSLPDKRTALYDNYVSLFFNREAEKSTVVREHRELLLHIHQYLAWVLHSEAEQEGRTGSVEAARLEQLVNHYLASHGYDTDLTEELFSGMIERVVALVSRVQGTYEFEVQPLREYFAARYLYTFAPYSPPGVDRTGTRPERFDAIARNHYWLNVTRFYAGCYCVGELASLVDRLEELARDPHFKQTCHPQTLAATLLSDRVFSSQPKLMLKVMNVVLAELKLWQACNNRGRHRRQDGAFSFPPGACAEAAVDKCFLELRGTAESDLSNSLLDVVVDNGSSDHIGRLWRENTFAVSGDHRTRWLRYGLKLNTLPQLSGEELTAILSDVGLTGARLESLLAAGHGEYCEDASRFASCMALVLNGDATLSITRRPRSILESLGNSLNARRYVLAMENRAPVPLRGVQARYAINDARLPDEYTVSSYDGVKAKCVDFIRAADLAMDVTCDEWATTLDPWNALVETGRRVFGDVWSLRCMAVWSAGIRSKELRCDECDEVFDVSKALCERARHARMKAKSYQWWRAQLERAGGDEDKMWCLLLCFAWAGPVAMSKVAELLNEVLRSLPPESWFRLWRATRQAMWNRAEGTRMFGLVLSDLPARLDARTVAVLCSRSRRDGLQKLYARYLQEYAGDDPAVLEMCHAAAMCAIASDSSEWGRYLPVLRRCHAARVAAHPYTIHVVMRSEPAPMPNDVAREVMQSSNAYSNEVIRAAEWVCREQASMTVEPVGIIADRDQWFVNV